MQPNFFLCLLGCPNLQHPGPVRHPVQQALHLLLREHPSSHNPAPAITDILGLLGHYLSSHLTLPTTYETVRLARQRPCGGPRGPVWPTQRTTGATPLKVAINPDCTSLTEHLAAQLCWQPDPDKPNHEYWVSFQSLPDVLLVHLDILQAPSTLASDRKIRQPLALEPVINLQRHTNPFAMKPPGSAIYNLASVIFHQETDDGQEQYYCYTASGSGQWQRWDQASREWCPWQHVDADAMVVFSVNPADRATPYILCYEKTLHLLDGHHHPPGPLATACSGPQTGTPSAPNTDNGVIDPWAAATLHNSGWPCVTPRPPIPVSAARTLVGRHRGLGAKPGQWKSSHSKHQNSTRRRTTLAQRRQQSGHATTLKQWVMQQMFIGTLHCNPRCSRTSESKL